MPILSRKVPQKFSLFSKKNRIRKIRSNEESKKKKYLVKKS